MYNPTAGGMARFRAGVWPLLVCLWQVADLPAVSALHAMAGGGNVPVHQLLGPVEVGR